MCFIYQETVPYISLLLENRMKVAHYFLSVHQEWEKKNELYILYATYKVNHEYIEMPQTTLLKSFLSS